MWKRRQPEECIGEDGLGEECDALLRGEWAEYRQARGEALPRWAWLNRVAHAPEPALRVIARRPDRYERHVDDWAGMRACVAESLLKQAAEKGVTAAELQQVVLVPIELALFSRDESRLPADPEILIRILSALRHPSAQPRHREG